MLPASPRVRILLHYGFKGTAQHLPALLEDWAEKGVKAAAASALKAIGRLIRYRGS